MSIIVKEGNKDVPENYIRCSKAEALQHQWRTISEWKSKWDVWPFTQGPGVLGIAGAITGGCIASYVRLKLNLNRFGRVAMLLPTMGVPAAFCPLLNLRLVGEPVLLQSECPICLQMRSMLVQSLVGVGYPIVVGSASGLYLAEQYSTHRLPEFSMRAIPQFVNIAKSALLSYKNPIIVLTMFNMLLAGFITDRQANSIFTIARKLEEGELDDEP